MISSDLTSLIDSFHDLKVLVVGEAMLDSYLEGDTERLCREAPVPVVSIQERVDFPGGAANTAANLQSLGSEVIFLSVIGADREGLTLRQALERRGVSPDHLLIDPNRQTLAKQRVVAASQMVVRFDQGSQTQLAADMEEALIKRIQQLFPNSDAVILSDYDYGILTPGVIQAIEELQAKLPRLLFVDSKRIPVYQNLNVAAIKPNFQEALQLLGLKGTEVFPQNNRRVGLVEQYADKILEISGAQIAAITLDQEGALIFQRGGEPYRTYAKAAPNSRASGAGDTFISTLALALAAGSGVERAAELASAAASIVVGKNGTATCGSEELKAHFATDEKVVTDVFQLAVRMSTYRQEGKRIVFTNGCFDLLHRGHISYLNRAKSLGDILILGLNSDASVRRLKGPTRPITPLEDRAQVLAALSCIDHIIPFDADTPHELIRQIHPDIFVKGGDYTRQTLPETALVEELGGIVEILPYVDEQSTTNIIERIRKIYSLESPEKT